MLFTYMTYSAYELYVALLDALISVAVALSVVVSLDRVFHVMKYVQLKMRSRVTGRRPEEYYQFNALPDPVRAPQSPALMTPGAGPVCPSGGHPAAQHPWGGARLASACTAASHMCRSPWMAA